MRITMTIKSLIGCIFFSHLCWIAVAKEPVPTPVPKGILPELKIEGTDEAKNQKKALQSEILISQAEQRAINSLMDILKRKKGSPEEPDLWFRLAELYMRRSKTGRFFDLNRDNKDTVKFAPPEAKGETATSNLKKAIQIYTKIRNEFPKFGDMDAVLFNAGFASQQIDMQKQAKTYYEELVARFPKSTAIPDARLALGEIQYRAGDFKGALDHFLAIDQFPQSRVFSYGLYKAAWSYYNLHHTEQAMKKLVEVVNYFDPKKTDISKSTYNLRTEALRDLAIFFEDSSSPELAYEYFSKFATPDELGEAMIQIGKIYEAHSRYKNLVTFLNDFAKKDPGSPFRVKAHLLIVAAHESLKERNDVIRQLKILSGLCTADSAWALGNQKVFEESCNSEFSRQSLELAKKWWDIWLNNKSHKEFSELTKQAFSLLLDREDPKHPDIKSRFAYAELLFQLGEFKQAGKNYMLVAERTEDAKLRHDSSYAALISQDKVAEKTTDGSEDADSLTYANKYLQLNPAGIYADQVKFKIGFIYYNQKKLVEAEKMLKPLATAPPSKKDIEIQHRAQDLVLDIYNNNKDLKSLKEFAKSLLSSNLEESRKVHLNKIIQEAEYTEIQEGAKIGDKVESAKKLVRFHNENPKFAMAKDSLWQAMGLYYSAGHEVDGARIAELFTKLYPSDSKITDALIDATRAYTEAGDIDSAIRTLTMLIDRNPKTIEKNIETLSELYLLNGDKKMAIKSLKRLLAGKKQDQGPILSKILAAMHGDEKSSEYQELEGKLVALGQEPIASEVKLRRVDSLLSAKKYADAFNAAKPLVSAAKGTPDEVRAKARLIQARVLEEEHRQQSTKTSIEKLSTILAMKTEKLDKAQIAFIDAAKMSKSPQVQLEALQGLNRIYHNYVEAVSHPTLKTELTPDEKSALQVELKKLTAPIAEKIADTDGKLKTLAKENKVSQSQEINFANLEATDVVKARIPHLSDEKIREFLPEISENLSDPAVRRFTVSTKSANSKCSFGEKDENLSLIDLSSKANQCIIQTNYELAAKISYDIGRLYPQTSLGLYYLSVIAGQQKNHIKALWLIEKALKREAPPSYFFYQKARIHYALGENLEANQFFIKAYDLKLAAEEVKLMHGVIGYTEGDCYSVVNEFGNFEKSRLIAYKLGSALAECYAQKGDFDKSFSLLKDLLKSSETNVDLYLERAYIFEIYKADTKETMKAYNDALKITPDGDMKEWMIRKLEALRTTAP